jgi:menaquinone-9 beta-reductase
MRALHSARLGAEYYLAGKSSSEFQTCLARDVTGQVRRATLISRVLVRRWGQGAMVGVARLAPRLISDIADLTRIPSHRRV